MAERANHPFRIYRGDTWRQELTMYVDETQSSPFDLTNYTVTGHARIAPDDSKWFDLNITITDAVQGVMEIHHTNLETTSLASSELTGNYDIQLTDQTSGDVFTFLYGTITVTKDYTHS